MSKTQHTAGPWKASHIGEGEYRREIVIDVRMCGQIAEVLDVGNGEANARLIAAAPQLAEALKGLEEHSSQLNRAFYVDGTPKAMREVMKGQKELLQAARAALKAAGVGE